MVTTLHQTQISGKFKKLHLTITLIFLGFENIGLVTYFFFGDIIKNLQVFDTKISKCAIVVRNFVAKTSIPGQFFCISGSDFTVVQKIQSETSTTEANVLKILTVKITDFSLFL